MSSFHHNLPLMSSAASPDFMDSQKTQARHYKTLQEMCKSKKPNKAAITHVLNLEFESRRRFITSDVLKEQDRPAKILEAYPCFRELDHVSNVGPIHSTFSSKDLFYHDIFCIVFTLGIIDFVWITLIIRMLDKE